MGFRNMENAIYFENIKYGFDNYKNEKLIMNEEEAFLFFVEQYLQAKKDSVYVDFYYGCLDENAKELIEKELTEEEKIYLQKTIMKDEIIYLANETFLKIVTKLNARETLFSTIYFTGEVEDRSTWWGNYNKEYFVFRES